MHEVVHKEYPHDYKNNTPRIEIYKSVHGTIDATVYNMPDTKLVDWFSLVDIWGSRGYDRYGDNGLYFELPKELYDIIPNLPFISKYHIEIVQ